MARKFLLDTNVLIALTEVEHMHHRRAQDWLNAYGKRPWGLCPLSEAGFIRITTNSRLYPNPRSIAETVAILQTIHVLPHFSYWGMVESWVTLTAPFVTRISGHQQVTDAYLLGLAIKEDGVLVTFDKRIRYMAGAEFRQNVLLLDAG